MLPKGAFSKIFFTLILYNIGKKLFSIVNQRGNRIFSMYTMNESFEVLEEALLDIDGLLELFSFKDFRRHSCFQSYFHIDQLIYRCLSKRFLVGH